MKISNASLSPYTLPLNAKWQSHSYATDVRQGCLVTIEDNLGNIGFGDCAPLPSHGTESAAEALEKLNQQLPSLSGLLAIEALNRLPDIDSSLATRCAIETALIDLITKQEATPLHKWLNPESGSTVKANANVGALNEGLNERIYTAIEQGYSTIKIKIGRFKLEHELELLNQICRDLPTNIQLRLDANRAWDAKTAKYILKQINQMPIESLEEPITESDINALKRLQDGTDITLALDESVARLCPQQLSQLHPLHRIILKPMILGGVLPALHLGQHAHDLGMETVVTTTIDSAAGVWAATQLAAALDPECKLHHGVATNNWLQQDLGAGPEFNKGVTTIPQTAGLSFAPYD